MITDYKQGTLTELNASQFIETLCTCIVLSPELDVENSHYQCCGRTLNTLLLSADPKSVKNSVSSTIASFFDCIIKRSQSTFYLYDINNHEGSKIATYIGLVCEALTMKLT